MEITTAYYNAFSKMQLGLIHHRKGEQYEKEKRLFWTW